jgi:hypothetical protein
MYCLTMLKGPPPVVATKELLVHKSGNVRRSVLRTPDDMVVAGREHVPLAPVHLVHSISIEHLTIYCQEHLFQDSLLPLSFI